LYFSVESSSKQCRKSPHEPIYEVGFKVLKYVLIDLCDKCGVCAIVPLSGVVNPHSYACLYDFSKS